jgi:membrane protease YdiL (CAAX protease family)
MKNTAVSNPVIAKWASVSIIILIAAWPFLRLLKFPFSLPALALLLTVGVCLLCRSISSIGFRKPPSAKRFFILVIVSFIVTELLFDLLLQPLTNRLFNEPADYSVFAALRNNTPLFLKFIAYTWLSAAIAEEIIYRGILVFLLEKTGLKSVYTIVAQALVFASAHFYQGWSGLLITFLFGLAFGIIYQKSNRSIWVVILVHGLVDSLFLILAYTGQLQWYEDPFAVLF